MTAKRTQRWWTDEEVGFLIDHPHATAADLALELGRSVDSVKKKRQHIEHGWEPQSEAWTASEDDFILANPHLTVSQVANHLGRTRAATSMRRSIVGRREGVGFKASKRASHIGERTMLAKTCPRCGLFLGSRWFGRDTDKTWRSYCIRCRPKQERNYKGKEQRPEQAAFWKRVQNYTRERATNNGQPWIEKDHEVLRDPDLPIITKALRLGRTYAATARMCSQNGYVSMVGLGPAERAQWLIYFTASERAA